MPTAIFRPIGSPQSAQNGAGPHSLSEAETKAIADFLIAHPNIHGSQHFHTFSGAIPHPPTSHPIADLAELDRNILKLISKMGGEETG